MHIAINSGASAPNPSARPFDPAQWLSAYVELGGGYTVTGASCCLHYPRRLSHAELSALAVHQQTLIADRGKREAVRVLLTSRCVREVVSC